MCASNQLKGEANLSLYPPIAQVWRNLAMSAKLLVAAAAAHLLAVLRLLCIDLAQPPFTAILLPSELRRVSRSLLLVHRTALPQLNATLHSLAALPGAEELRITLWQPLHTSGNGAGDATARLLRSIRHLGLAISHHRPDTCRPQTCRRLAAGSAAAMGGLRTAATAMADKLVDGLDVAFAGEVAHRRRTPHDPATLLCTASPVISRPASLGGRPSTRQSPHPHLRLRCHPRPRHLLHLYLRPRASPHRKPPSLTRRHRLS